MPKRMSDETVKAKTGKTWGEWFEALDAAGAQALSHPEIVTLVRKEPKASSWWQQTVAMEYEQARGLPVVQDKPEVFQVSVSKTFEIPAGTAFLMFHDPMMRKRWWKEASFRMRKATGNKSIILDWDGDTEVVITFVSKSANKTQVTVQHSKLAGAADSKRQRAYWTDQLDRLQHVLEM